MADLLVKQGVDTSATTAQARRFKDMGDGSVAEVHVAAAVAQLVDTKCSTWRKLATADTNLNSVKASAARLMGGVVVNTSAAIKYLKLYNKASAPVIASDSALLVMTLPIAASGGHLDLAAIFGALGHYFSTGFAYAITGAIGDTDTTALAANDVTVNFDYI